MNRRLLLSSSQTTPNRVHVAEKHHRARRQSAAAIGSEKTIGNTIIDTHLLVSLTVFSILEYIFSMNTLNLGMAVVQLGGGRLKKGDILDPSAGIIFHKKIGDIVSEGELLLEYYCSGEDKFEASKLYFNKIGK